MRRARFIDQHLTAAGQAALAARSGLEDPSLTREQRTVLGDLAEATRHLVEATRALYDEQRDHDHPDPRRMGPVLR